MIGSLIAAAGVAVLAVLFGSFNDTFLRALLTLLLVMVHALACLGFTNRAAGPARTSLRLFENIVFAVIVLSFFTSVLGTWHVLSGDVVGKLYGTYFIAVFASLHGQMIWDTTGKQSNIDKIVLANYIFMSLVVLLLLPIIWFPDTISDGFYYRLLAACGIIDATLTILAVILHRMYIQRHPEVQSTIFTVTAQTDAAGNPVPVQAVATKRHIHPLLWLLGIFLLGQVAISIFFAIFGALARYH